MQRVTPSPHNKSNETPATQSTTVSLSGNREAPSPPAPSVCDNTLTSLSSNQSEKYKCPNIIVDWNSLKDLVNSNLGPCPLCKGRNRALVKKMTVCYAVTLAIHCEDCEKRELQMYNNTIYEPKMLVTCDWGKKKERQEHRKAQLSLNYNQRKLKKIKLH